MWPYLRRLVRGPAQMEDRKPSKRSGHIAVVWNNTMFVWGGYYTNADDMTEYRHDPKVLWAYNLDQREWTKREVKGFVPPKLLASCYTCIEDCLIIFGGLTLEGDSNKLYCLHLKRFLWKLCTVEGTPPSPRNKLTCFNKDNLIVYFGGYGPEPNNRQIQNGDFTQDYTSAFHVRGWNNHLFAFDTESSSWVTLPNLGSRPSSRAAHASAVVGGKAYIFGGRHSEERLSDLFTLCLETFTWTSIINPSVIPVGRSWHTMTNVGCNILFIFGGLDTQQNILCDGWLYNADDNLWTEVHHKKEQHRLWHTACAGACEGEVVIFGGCEKNIFLEDPEHSDKLTVFNLQPKPLLRICLENLSMHHKMWSDKKKVLPTSLYNKLSRMAGIGG